MTPEEAFGHLRVTLPAAIDRVVAEKVGRDDTRAAIAPFAKLLRDAPDLDHAAALDQKLAEVAATDPPVEQRIADLMQPVRDKAEAETVPGQIKAAAKDAGDAAKKIGDAAVAVVGALALGWLLNKIADHFD